jgi:glyoxylase-like metal-dependent hydrolase (beta-lactamase superfamily II)
MLRYQIAPVTDLMQNCSIVWCDETKEGVLIDPGGEPDKLRRAVEDAGVTLKALWLTHGHLDHAGGAQSLREQLGIPVIGPAKADQFWLESIEEQCRMFGLFGLRNVDPDRWLEDNETLTIGNETLQVLTTPGHTPGHVIFYHEAQKLAWVGDVLFAGSVGRTDFPQSNHADLISSITNKLWKLGDDVKFIPGHGPESTFGRERKTNPFVGEDAL